MDDDSDSQGFLQSLLGIFTWNRPQRSVRSRPLNARQNDVWRQADLLAHNNDRDAVGRASAERTLRAAEHRYQADNGQGTGYTVQRPGPEPFPTNRRVASQPTPDLDVEPSIPRYRIKRGRQHEDVLDEVVNLDPESKRRRPLPGKEPSHGSHTEQPDADFAVLMRRHLVTLDSALKEKWVCVCQNCSGLTVGLSVPQHKKNLETQVSLEVFFGMRSVPATLLQEGRITVKDLRNSTPRCSSEVDRICPSITASLDQKVCLHFALEEGKFHRLPSELKAFSSDRISRTISLSTLFSRQQELPAAESVLSLKGKQILAVTLASALLPFLETPWLKFSFDHSKIQFFDPMKKGELPDITKPFLALEHVPSITARNNESSTASGSDALKHAVHPDASVLALGILLCELHYCLPVELIAEAKDPTVRKGVNDDLYTCMAKLDELEDNAGADYYHATKSCLTCDYYTAGESSEFGDVSVQRRFYQNVVKRLETGISKLWGIRLNNLDSFDSRQNSLCWGKRGSELVELHRNQMGPPDVERSTRVSPHHSLSKTAPKSKPSLHSNGLSSPKPPSGWQNQACFNESSKTSSAFFDASHQTGSEEERLLSERWMDNLLSSIYRFVDLDVDHVEPVRIAILDSGLDPDSPFLFEDQQLPNPKIKEVRSFIHGTESHDIRDEIGHGTHALGLLLKVAPCAEIYVARVARQETLDSDTYDDIAKAINHAVEEWGADIISMSFGIREQHEGMSRAISNALNKQTLLFAAASNDGANLSRAFPAKWPGVFCIHSTDGNGNPSSFNPTASETDVNFSLLGESVSSHWPAGLNGHDQSVNVMSGTSVATPIAAALAASVLSFVRQQDQNVAVESDRLGPWLKIDSSMDAVLKQMAAKRGAGYDCITPDILFTKGSTREFVYARIEHIKKNIYRH